MCLNLLEKTKTWRIVKLAHFEVLQKIQVTYAPCSFPWGTQNWSQILNRTSIVNVMT